MVHPRQDPARRCLKVEDWPAADRQEWERAIRPGSILLGGGGAASRWAPETLLKNRKGYGRWLNFLQSGGWLDLTVPPTERITPECVGAYVDLLRRQGVASWTLRGRIGELLAVALAFAPSTEWAWLKRALGRLEAVAENARPKEHRMRPAHEILDWAMSVLETMEVMDVSRKRDAVRYRDALTVALLITCPILRRHNLTEIAIGKHLRRVGTDYVLSFRARETKKKKIPIDAPLPPELTEFIDLYLMRFRPLLLRLRDSDRFWISWYGTPMSASSIYHRVTKVTARAFGRSINPHLFRDCAVTTTAVEEPAKIGIAPDILGHTSNRTTHQYYIRAKSLEASRRLRDSVEELRRSLPSRRAISRRRKNRSKSRNQG